MNSLWFKALFVLSLALNCVIAGGLFYKYFAVPHSLEQMQKPLAGSNLLHTLPPHVRTQRKGLYKQIKDLKWKIGKDREELFNLLSKTPPEREKITALVDVISRKQAAMQHTITNRILEDLQHVSPEQKDAYLSMLKKRMFREKRGRRMGRGKKGPMRGDGAFGRKDMSK